MIGDPHKTKGHKEVLDALAAKGRLRALAPRGGRDFTSNDFLALAESRALRDAASAALARGVPVGGELEYVDAGTIARAMLDRRST